MPMLEPGTPAPPFEVPDHTGKTVRLSDYRGSSVVLWFYPKADTPGCTAEGCGFRDHFKAYGEKGVRILGISFDTIPDNAAFARKFSFDFPLLCDTDRAVGLAYGAADDKEALYPKRVSYLIDPSGSIKKTYPKVNAASHPEEILRDL
jgi:thioredoxin-dependent peroxiredoxin